jgi:hypothetical protein
MLRFVKYMDLSGWTSQGIKDDITMYSRRDEKTVGVLM